VSFESKIYEDFNRFKFYYELLVERITNDKFKLSVRSYPDVFLLIRLLNFLDYSFDGFLIANFMDYDVNFDGKYPSIRYLLNNRTCFNKFEVYHKKLGNSESVISYSKPMNLLSSMRDSAYLWHQTLIDSLELKAKVVIPTTSFVFKAYMSLYHRDIIDLSGIDFKSTGFIKGRNNVLKYVSSKLLDDIFKEEKTSV
jgi:hypothetical protein